MSFDCFDLGKLFTGLLPISYTVAPQVGGDVPLSATPGSVTLNTVENGSTATVLAVTLPSWNPQVTATVEYPGNAASGWLTPTAVTGGSSSRPMPPDSSRARTPPRCGCTARTLPPTF